MRRIVEWKNGETDMFWNMKREIDLTTPRPAPFMAMSPMYPLKKIQVRKLKKKKKKIKKGNSNNSLAHLPLHKQIIHSFQYPFNFEAEKICENSRKMQQQDVL